MVLALVNTWVLSMTLYLLHGLVAVRLQRLFVTRITLFWGHHYICRVRDTHYKRIARLVLCQSPFLFWFVDLLQLRHWHRLWLINITLLVANRDLTHKAVRITRASLSRHDCWVICPLVLNGTTLLFRPYGCVSGRLRFCNLNDVLLLEIVLIILLIALIR